jgi:hypothetical protein
LLPIRRPLVAVRGHGANDTGLVREVQVGKLAVFLHGVVPLLFEDNATLMMDLVRRSKTFGGRFDLRSPANPHINRKVQDGIGGELMQIDVEIPEDVDNNWMKREPKPDKQQIPEDNNFVLLGFGTVSHLGALTVPTSEGRICRPHLSGSV